MPYKSIISQRNFVAPQSFHHQTMLPHSHFIIKSFPVFT